MGYYLVQASYGPSAIGAMVKSPQDRAAAIRPLMEKLGGKLHGMWFTFGEYDLVALAEMPDATTAAAFGFAISRGFRNGPLACSSRVAARPSQKNPPT